MLVEPFLSLNLFRCLHVSHPDPFIVLKPHRLLGATPFSPLKIESLGNNCHHLLSSSYALIDNISYDFDTKLCKGITSSIPSIQIRRG